MADKKVLLKRTVRHFLIANATSARDMASELNKFMVMEEGGTVDVPNFGADAVNREGGIAAYSLSFEGFTSAADDYSKIAEHFTFFAPDNVSQQGDFGYFGDAVQGTYEVKGTVGEAEGFVLSAAANGMVTRGPILRNAYQDSAGASAADTGPETGDEVEIGTVSASQNLYAAVFLLAFTGTSITFGIETDATGFSAPTERIVLGPLTAPGADYDSAAGPITPDDFVRVVTTGTFTSATFLVVAGVGR